MRNTRKHDEYCNIDTDVVVVPHDSYSIHWNAMLLTLTGAITGRSPSPSTPTEEDDVTAPKVISTSREGPEAPLQEPEPEPRKDEGAVNNVNDMNGASEAMKHFLEMGLEGDEDEISGNDLKDPEVEIPETQVEEVALPSEDLAMEDSEEAEHLALADDLAKLEAEIALAEQLLNPCPQDPEEPEPAAELLGSVPMVSCQSLTCWKLGFLFLGFEMTEQWWTYVGGVRCIHKPSCAVVDITIVYPKHQAVATVSVKVPVTLESDEQPVISVPCIAEISGRWNRKSGDLMICHQDILRWFHLWTSMPCLIIWCLYMCFHDIFDMIWKTLGTMPCSSIHLPGIFYRKINHLIRWIWNPLPKKQRSFWPRQWWD